MATTIVTKYGGDAPAASDIVRGELAVDTENGRLYTENAAGAVVEIGLNPEGNVDVTGTVTATSAQDYQFTAAFNASNSTSYGYYGIKNNNVGNPFYFHVGGAERLRIDSAGSTIIKSGNKLILNRTDNAIGGEMSYVAGTGFIFNDANGDGVSFNQGVANKVRIDSAGNVGIGTSSFNATYDPRLQVTSAASDGTGGVLIQNYLPTLTLEDISGGAAVSQIQQDQTSMVFKNNGATRMTLDASGNILFGSNGQGYISGTVANTYNSGYNQDDDSWATWMNYYGYQGGTTRYRDFIVGDGKNGRVATFDGSAGNLLVGTTSAFGTTGTTINAAGLVYSSADGDRSGQFDRTTSDGEVIRFSKAGTTVGSIGTNSGFPYIAAPANFSLMLATTDFRPRTVTGASDNDAAVDLGTSGSRFKDLYLSGFVSGGSSTGLTTRAVVSGGVTALKLQQARGSIASPTVSASGGDGNYIQSEVYDGSAFNSIAYIGMVTGTSLDDGDIVFGTAKAGSTTTKMTLDEDGNLLVGTTTSAMTAGGVRLKNGGGNLGEIALSNNSGSADYVARFLWGSTPTLVGNITVSSTATAYNTSSDQRLKENIVDAPSASDDIDAIQVRSFDWKADGSHQKYGMVAQELQTVAPEAVSASEDPEEMMGVDYSKLVPMMLKEIQSLRARVAQLES